MAELNVAGADLVEAFGHYPRRNFRAVAFAAQMRQIKVPESGGHDFGHSFGGGLVGEMPMASENPLFQSPGAAGILEQFDIMVGFEHEDIGEPNTFEHEFGHVSQIGDEPDIAGAGPE